MIELILQFLKDWHWQTLRKIT